ncbi:SCO family protein [Bernardetia sp. ABR2-2B]|uniref:SCO family protein n=1 Tax=Bernardetia sp. ABR2-2B TaxID=3127472 RepID=UPI0030D18650
MSDKSDSLPEKKNYKNLAVLLTILVLPALFIFFLMTGETKHKVLPIMYSLRLPEFDPTFIKASGCEPNFVDSTHRTIPFSLTNQLGETISQEDLRGNIYVANFILTRCTQNICPKMASEMIRVQEAFKDDKNVKIISYSIDPTYDTPKVLKEYAEKYGADNSKWHFLTGTEEEIFQQAKCSYFLPAEKKDTYVNIDHSERFVLVDKKGQIRGYYKGTDLNDVDRLIHEIQVLQLEDEQ